MNINNTMKPTQTLSPIHHVNVCFSISAKSFKKYKFITFSWLSSLHKYSNRSKQNIPLLKSNYLKVKNLTPLSLFRILQESNLITSYWCINIIPACPCKQCLCLSAYNCYYKGSEGRGGAACVCVSVCKSRLPGQESDGRPLWRRNHQLGFTLRNYAPL